VGELKLYPRHPAFLETVFASGLYIILAEKKPPPAFSLDKRRKKKQNSVALRTEQPGERAVCSGFFCDNCV